MRVILKNNSSQINGTNEKKGAGAGENFVNDSELGRVIAIARNDLSLSVEKLAELTRIPVYHLEALERNRFDKLPPPTYLKGIIRRVAGALGVDGDTLIKIYEKEAGENSSEVPAPDSQKSIFFDPLITPQRIGVTLGSLLLVFVLGYVWYQYDYLVSPPGLVILDPDRDLVTNQSSFEIRGQADVDSDLTINGESIFVGADGFFSKNVGLVAGLNAIEIKARNKYGRSSSVVRKILFSNLYSATSTPQ